MRLYFKYMIMEIRCKMEYRMSFWLGICTQFAVAFSAFIGVAMLFSRFGSAGGWSIWEVALCFGVAHITFFLAQCFARGFDLFSAMIVKGDFDRVLLRPRSGILQVMGTQAGLSRMGDLLQGAAVLSFAIVMLDISWSADKIATLIFMLTGGTGVFIGIFIIGAAICFLTVEGLEFVNIFTNGGQELASYPMTIYGKWMRSFFTFIVPLGAINYLPLMYITGRVENHSVLYMLAPLAGVLFVLPSIVIWKLGVRYYTSTGS